MDFNFPISWNNNKKILSKPWSSYPRYNIEECDNYYIYHIDVPGVEKKNLKLSITNYDMNISGERFYTFDIEDAQYTYTESNYGVFSRNILIKKDADTDSCKADLENGVLRIKINKLE